MPRRARRDYETCFFHIIVQGINKEYIFKNESYIKEYYKLLMENREKYDIKIMTYCIMNNHAHFLIYSESIEDLGKFMKVVNTSYAIFYNKNENRVGYVFRDRYLSEPIMNERQLFNCIAYIHFNPIKANLVKRLGEYKYSSFMDFINKRGICTNDSLSLLFGTSSDYLDIFYFIHFGVEDCLDVKDFENKKTSFECNSELAEKVLNLKASGVSNRKISEILGVNRNRINKMAHQGPSL